MRFSEHYKLNRNQPYLDFVDIRLDTDTSVFVNPGAIRALPSEWGSECVSLLQYFFDTVIKHINNNNNQDAINILSSLNERNEFHLGYSKGRSRGHGFGSISGSHVWKALSESKAAKSGLLTDLDDACLLIKGIGPDMISDAVCNVIRGPLISYTQKMCEYHDIEMEPGIDSGPIWNPIKEKWEREFVNLPMTDYGKIILVPKVIVRFAPQFGGSNYYDNYLIPTLRMEELSANTSLVETLKDGRKRVTKKKLVGKYGASKLTIAEETIKRPELLKRYKQDVKDHPSKPLSHADFAEVENSELPKLNKLFESIVRIRPGVEGASDYEDAIEKFLTAIFYPSLGSPQKQHKIHNGRKRIDITYVNYANEGFYDWIGRHYPAAHIFVECKNYGKEIGNPELDQISGRFSPRRGQIGIIVCRSLADKNLVANRCRDTANDGRGYVIALDDNDLKELLDEYLKAKNYQDYGFLKKKFGLLVM